jgi:hypothetical protein
MEEMPPASRKAFIAAMRKRFEQAMGEVVEAVNEAPTGHVIAGSEEQVRDVFARLRQEAYQLALQERVDAAEAAFPPPEGSPDESSQTQ